jgi:2-polyprenyl-3-methyl-5-hydroxy-6-metoxy-1,4-benzoquinol methylase
MSLTYKFLREKGNFEIYPDIIQFADILQNLFKKPDILDIGPGAGVISDYFSKRGFKTTAIDISKKMIEVAREASPLTQFLEGDFLEYNFKKKFNGIFSKAVLHLFTKEDSKFFLEKCKNLLSNNGLIYLSLFIRDYSDEGFKPKYMGGKKFFRYTKDWTRSELETLIKESSLNPTYTFELNKGNHIEWSSVLKK